MFLDDLFKRKESFFRTFKIFVVLMGSMGSVGSISKKPNEFFLFQNSRNKSIPQSLKRIGLNSRFSQNLFDSEGQKKLINFNYLRFTMNSLNLFLMGNSCLTILFILNQNDSTKDLTTKTTSVSNPLENFTWVCFFIQLVLLLIKTKTTDF